MEEMKLMTAIIESNPGIGVEDAWKMYRELVTRVCNLSSCLKVGDPGQSPDFNAEGQAPENTKPAESVTKGYTRRNLKIRPQDAITKEHIACCICGKSMNAINTRHLASHNGLTKEGYIKLCGYPANQILMSHNHLAKMQIQVRKAQKAREKKQAEQQEKSAPLKVRRARKEA